MSRSHALDDRHDVADIDPIDRPARHEVAEPADGCTSTPWCLCHDCERVNPPVDFDDWEI
jgi:hypothetical protein